MGSRPEDEGSSERSDEGSEGRSPERSNGRTDEHAEDTAYVITVPGERRKARQSFGIYEDQKRALDTLQMAVRDVEGEKPDLGAMVREALAAYIERRTKELPNVRRKEGARD